MRNDVWLAFDHVALLSFLEKYNDNKIGLYFIFTTAMSKFSDFICLLAEF